MFQFFEDWLERKINLKVDTKIIPLIRKKWLKKYAQKNAEKGRLLLQTELMNLDQRFGSEIKRLVFAKRSILHANIKRAKFFFGAVSSLRLLGVALYFF